MKYASGKMIVHKENIVIRQDGCERLTKRAPRGAIGCRMRCAALVHRHL